MTIKRCPYCNTEVDENDTVCKNCKQSLLTQCPYCKQEIKVYDKICPFCTTKLAKPKEPKYLFIIGCIFFGIWFVINLALSIGITHVPQILTERDKDGMLVMDLGKYINLVFRPLVLITIPYIIAIVKKYKTQTAILFIVVNVIAGIAFTGYFAHLQSIYLK